MLAVEALLSSECFPAKKFTGIFCYLCVQVNKIFSVVCCNKFCGVTCWGKRLDLTSLTLRPRSVLNSEGEIQDCLWIGCSWRKIDNSVLSAC